MALFEARKVHKRFGDHVVLEEINLEFEEHRLSGIMGPNGAGKTTTLRSILGLTPAIRGSIHFDGTENTAMPTHEIAQRRIGWVPDDRRIYPTLTVGRNRSIANKRTRFRQWNRAEMFEIFSALEYLMGRECEILSGGEMQMIAISRALLGFLGLVLFVEPFQGLAPKIMQDVMKTIEGLKGDGISVLIVGQNALSALAVSDRLAILYHRCYQVRHFSRLKPSFLMRPAGSDYPVVHLFDEPQFTTQDGDTGFMLDFFRKLRGDGRLLFVCVHPNEPFHLDIMHEICERFIFVQKGRPSNFDDFPSALAHAPMRDYLGDLVDRTA